MVGAPNVNDGGNNRGAIFVIFLNANGGANRIQKIGSISGNGPTLMNGEQFGADVSAMGGLDGDGIQELAVGSFISTASSEGRLYLLSLIAENSFQSTGVYEAVVRTEGTLTSWKRFQVNQDVPAGTEILYTLLDETTNTVLFGPDDLDAGFAAISAIPASHTQLVLRAGFSSTQPFVSPCLQGWRVSYLTEEMPAFTLTITRSVSRFWNCRGSPDSSGWIVTRT